MDLALDNPQESISHIPQASQTNPERYYKNTVPLPRNNYLDRALYKELMCR